MLHIEDLWIRRGAAFRMELPLLRLGRGEVAAVTGPSGCGKSTLLEMIGLILRPEGIGCFRLGDGEGQDVAKCIAAGREERLARIRAKHLGFVLQNGGLLPFLSVRQNIELPRRMLGLPTGSKLVAETLERLDLTGLLDRRPAQLSIGERQRASFVRAIAHEPQMLLADEPTAALDPPQSRRLFELIIEIVRRFRIAALLVSHDWALVNACAIRTIIGKPQTSGNGTVFQDVC
jgi:putative ABC transport system ATP-binding protein